MSELNKLPKGSYGFDNAWHRKQPIMTPVGKFEVEFFMVYDNNPPDDEMLRLADELVEYARTKGEHIRDIIYGSYRYAVTEHGPDSVESCGVPADLKPDQITKYCAPVLVVERNPAADFEGPPYECRISADPEWEPEHNLSLEFSNGTIVTVNQEPFKIVDGILRGG